MNHQNAADTNLLSTLLVKSFVVLNYSTTKMAEAEKEGEKTPTPVEDMSLLSITDGENARGIPFVKFIDDVDSFANSFTPPASAELMIGAYSELHSKFKTFETTLTQKSKLVAVVHNMLN